VSIIRRGATADSTTRATRLALAPWSCISRFRCGTRRGAAPPGPGIPDDDGDDDDDAPERFISRSIVAADEVTGNRKR
jgi:hypothetical protein